MPQMVMGLLCSRRFCGPSHSEITTVRLCTASSPFIRREQHHDHPHHFRRTLILPSVIRPILHCSPHRIIRWFLHASKRTSLVDEHSPITEPSSISTSSPLSRHNVGRPFVTTRKSRLAVLCMPPSAKGAMIVSLRHMSTNMPICTGR